MTAIISKPAQNRLDSCALARPKWAKIRKPRRKHTRGTLRIDILVADAAVRVENAQQNGQTRGNTKLLGKYRIMGLVYVFERLCCTNGMRDSLFESSWVATMHEQLVPYEVQDQELAFVQHGVKAARFAINLV